MAFSRTTSLDTTTSNVQRRWTRLAIILLAMGLFGARAGSAQATGSAALPAHSTPERKSSSRMPGIRDASTDTLSLPSDLRRAYAEILSAAERGDIIDVVRWARAAPGFVGYSAIRNAVQVRDCKQIALIANIPVRSRADSIAAKTLSVWRR